MDGLQQQSATLKKLNTPSDDPVGASKVLEIRTDKVNNDQYQMNAKLAETFLSNSEHTLGELADIVLRAKEIALGQASGASSNDSSRLGIAEEVSQLYNQAVAAANRRIGDRYLFGGYKTQKPPVDPEGRYLGDSGQMMSEIGKGVFLTMNVTGLEAFNTNPQAASQPLKNELTGRKPANRTLEGPDGGPAEASAENINVFSELQNLRISLLSGNLDGVRDTLERFDQLHGKLNAVRAKIGSRMQGVQNVLQSNERHNVTNAQLSSSIEDADMAQVVSDLAKEETVFRSALASSQKLLQPTLLQFLK
jgi:flagellar hook-associated protein 3 FlgL